MKSVTKQRQTISEATQAAMDLVRTPGFQMQIGCVLLGRWLDGSDLTIDQTARRFFAEAAAAYDARLSPDVRHLCHMADSQRSYEIEKAQADARL
jgi:hypothetical protein